MRGLPRLQRLHVEYLQTRVWEVGQLNGPKWNIVQRLAGYKSIPGRAQPDLKTSFRFPLSHRILSPAVNNVLRLHSVARVQTHPSLPLQTSGMKQSLFDLPRSRVERNNVKDEPPAARKMPEDCPAEEAPEEWRAGKQEWLILIALMVTCLMVSIDSTILVPVLPVRIATSEAKRSF